MTTTVSLEGIYSIGGDEPRAVAAVSVDINGEVYPWQMYIPEGTQDLAAFLDASIPELEALIAAKEAVWLALEPKTRTVVDPFTQEETVEPINKSEIVKPDIPDYYAKRRAAYPPTNEQLAALWKGVGSSEFVSVLSKIADVKNAHPKPYMTPTQQAQYPLDLQETIVNATQMRLDMFARTRGYDSVNSISKYQNITDDELASLEGAEQIFVTKFRAECRYLALITARTWARLYEVLAEVQGGTRPLPGSFSDIETLLPELEWPV